MTELRGSWRPARVALRRILAAQLAARPSDPAFSDSDGTLTRAELWRLVRSRSAEPTEPVVIVSSPNPRTVVVDALAGWLAGRMVLVVPPRSGERVLRAARAAAPRGAGVFFATSGTTGSARVVRSRRGLRALAQLAAPIGILPLARRPVIAGLAPVDHGHGFTAVLATLALGGCPASASGSGTAAWRCAPRCWAGAASPPTTASCETGWSTSAVGWTASG